MRFLQKHYDVFLETSSCFFQNILMFFGGEPDRSFPTEQPAAEKRIKTKVLEKLVILNPLQKANFVYELLYLRINSETI